MRYYSVGTVVSVKDSDAVLMIAGYLPHIEDNKTYDYFGVAYPFGMLKMDDYICFDHKIIDKVIHMGYSDSQTEEFLDGYEQMYRNIKGDTATDGFGE